MKLDLPRLSALSDMMQRAVQLDPNNRLYHSLLNQYRSRSQQSPFRTYTYRTGQSTGTSGFSIIGKIFWGWIMLQLLLGLLRFLFFGFRFTF